MKPKTLFTSMLFLTVINTISFAQKIQTKYSSNLFAGPFSGKVILYLSKELRSPKDATNNIPPFCCFAITVKNIKPNSMVVFDDSAISYPVMLSDIERGEY